MKVKVGISNHHVHLTKDAYNILFPNKKIEIRNSLNQIGEFASTDMVSLEYNNKVIKNVRIVGPFRNENQVELLGSDLKYLNLYAPVRRSGELNDTPGIKIVNGDKSIKIDHGVIRAEKHVHVPTKDVEKYNLYERDKVILFTNDNSFLANVKVSDNGFFEVHIDKDEALEYNVHNGDELELKKCGE